MTEEEEFEHLKIIDLNNCYTVNAYSKLEGEQNALFSSINLHTLFSLLSESASYRNRSNNFKSALRIYNNKDIYQKCYKEFLLYLHSKLNNGLALASKLYLRDNYELQKDFKDIINSFHYEIGTADFSTTDSIAKTLNSWFEDKTKVAIGNLVSSDVLSNETRLALLNAVHFKEKWAAPFTLEANPTTFHINKNESVQTQMMKIKGQYCCKFNDDSPVKTIELPLASDEFSLFIVLPGKGFASEETYLEWYFRDEINNMDREEIDVYLPKFKVEELLNCRSILSNLGIDEEFEDNVNIFDMIECEELLKYDQLYEKASFKLDETGIEAASGLCVTLVPTELDGEVISADGLKMSELNVKTVISNRFGKTLVTSKVQNKNQSAKEATFTVILPETAFITEFIMEMDGKSYKSYIKGQEEAKAIYEEAVKVGRSAGIVEADTRDSSKFVVSVNLEPQSTAVFLLTYEEMLQRIHDQYELVLNICPGQVVDNLNVDVTIKESRPLQFVKTPPIRSGKEIDPNIAKYLKPVADIETVNPNTSIVKFSADAKYQRKIASYIGTPLLEGFSGQFVVQYDVERDPKDGEILLQDGYFVHFFAPNDLDPLPKHVVFVLDTSPSMDGRKICQLKDAMMSILSEIRKGDLISILEFNEHVVVWDIIAEESKTIFCHDWTDFKEPFGTLGKLSLPNAVPAEDLTINKAKSVVQKMFTTGATFMIGGLETGLYIVKTSQEQLIDKSSKCQPILIFLTDGIPNVGIGSSPQIVQLVTRLNLQHNKVPIFSLSFGEGAEKAFLRELSLKNFGFSKHIYEAADASIQLQSFYKQISSPLLSDIKFKYQSDVTEVTRSHFPIYFGGSELVVSGRCTGSDLSHNVNGYGPNGYLNLGSIVKDPVTSLERLWAYLTVKQLLEERNAADNKEELTKKAFDLALKYSFVTEVTSLVIVKPDEVCRTDEDDVPSDAVLEMESAGQPKKKVIRKRVIKKSIKCEEGKKPLETQLVELIEELPECLEVREVVPEEPKKTPKMSEFIADHPFLFALTLKKEERRIILFIGWVYKPSS